MEPVTGSSADPATTSTVGLSHQDQTGESQSEDPHVHVMACLSLLILLFGNVTNIVTVVTIVCHRTLRILPNTLVVSMCVNNLLFLLGVVVPTTFHQLINLFDWNNRNCGVFVSFRAVVNFLSIFNLTALAINRLFAVVFNHKPNLSGTCAIVIHLLLIYLVPTVAFIPVYQMTTSHVAYSPAVHSCIVRSEQLRELWKGIVNSCMMAPNIIIVICYAAIFFENLQSKRRLDDINLAMIRTTNKRRMNIQLSSSTALMAAVYSVTVTLPFALAQQMQDERKELLYLLVWTGIAINPVIYALKQKRFREIYIRLARDIYRRYWRHAAEINIQSGSSSSTTPRTT